MLYAIGSNTGEKVRPTATGQTATCDYCGSKVISKCGSFNIYHWAHAPFSECDSWRETKITEWHLKIQNALEYNKAKLEVTIEKNTERHRADAVLPDGTVIEVQTSPISLEEIKERERFYGNMIWIFDARETYEQDRFQITEEENYLKFRWKHPKKSIFYTSRPTFLHLEMGDFFHIKNCYPETYRGWGKIISLQEIISL